MKNELEKIKLEFNERIDSLLKKCVDPPKVEFEVGWYGYTDSSIHLVYLKNPNGMDCYGFDTGGWQQGSNWNTQNLRKLTESEIKEALSKEAEKRGFKEGVKFNCIKTGVNAVFRNETPSGKIGEWEYDLKSDTLSKLCNYYFYHKGKWATIQKEEAIKIGGYEVQVNGSWVNIGCKGMPVSELKSLKDLMDRNKFKKIQLDEYETTIETINAILEKLK